MLNVIPLPLLCQVVGLFKLVGIPHTKKIITILVDLESLLLM